MADGGVVSLDGGGTGLGVVGGATPAGWRGCAGRRAGQKVFGADGTGKPAAERLWTNGEHDLYLLPHDDAREPLGGDGAARQTDREHDRLYPGPATATSAGGSVWRNLYGRRRA